MRTMEKVYVKNSWYDGPREGIADFNGEPHRFVSHFNELNGHEDTFNLYPVTNEERLLKIEQWSIFVEWNKKYEAGEVDSETHPGHGDISKRWDEIEKILNTMRGNKTSNPSAAKAMFRENDQENRYEACGPDYGVIWKVVK